MSKRTGFPWRRVLKVTAISALTLLVLFGATTWILFRQRNAFVMEQIQTYLDQAQSGQLMISKMDLRLFRHFPDVSIEFDSVRYFEHRDTLRNPGEVPVVSADRIYVSLSWWALVNGRVEISEISISNGTVNLVEYARGVLNIQQALAKPRRPGPAPKQTPKTSTQPKKPAVTKPSKANPEQSIPPPTQGMKIDLETFVLEHIRLSWQPYGITNSSSLLVDELVANLDQSDAAVNVDLQARFLLDTIYLKNTRLPDTKLSLAIDGAWEKGTDKLTIKKSTVGLDVFTATAQGSYDHRNHRTLDLQVDASSNDLPLLEKILRPETISSNQDLLRGGDFYIQGRLYGSLEHNAPRFDFRFGAKDVSFRLPGKYGTFKDLGFEGSAVSGKATNYAEASFQLKNLKGQVPGGSIAGTIGLTNFVHPWLKCSLNTTFNLDGYDRVFRIDRVKDLEGTVKAIIHYDGRVPGMRSEATAPKATFDGSFSVDRLAFRLPGILDSFRNISLKGRFTSGPNPDQSQALLDVSEFRGEVPGGEIKGIFRMSNLVQPVLAYDLSAHLDLKGFDRLFNLNGIRELEGKATADLRFNGPLNLIGTHAMDSSRSSRLRLDSLSFRLANNRQISNLQASMVNQNNQAAVDLAFRYGESDLHLQATLENLMYRIFSGERIVQASGSLQSNQLFTRDLIFDSLRTPLVEDRISGLSMKFRLANVLPREEASSDELGFNFNIQSLTARLDKLPDVRMLDSQGTFRKSEKGIDLDLKTFNLKLPVGTVSIQGDMLIPARRQLNAHAHIKLTEFPWDYVSELVDEIKSGKEPSRKNMAENSMDKITGEVDVTGILRTYPFDFERLEIRNSNIRYHPSNGKDFSSSNISATFEPLYFLHPPHSGAISGLQTVKGIASVKGLKIPGLRDLQVDVSAKGAQDTLNLTFINTSPGAKKEEGQLRLDISQAERRVQFNYGVKARPVDALVKKFSKKDFLKGTIDYAIGLNTFGKNWEEAQHNLEGGIEIRSDSLDLVGIDIDDALTKYEKSQKFNLTDLGAVVLVGPIGIVATKGSDFVALATVDVNNRQRTHIQQLLAAWTLKHQVLKAADVAFATSKNRIAFNGALDFARDSIAGLQIAVVDKNGCSLMDQQIYGNFNAVKSGKLNIARTLFGSVINFVDAIAGKDCQPVYKGQVKDPRTKK